MTRQGWVVDLDKREREYLEKNKAYVPVISVTKDDKVPPKAPEGVRFCLHCGKQMSPHSAQLCIIANGYCVAEDPEPKTGVSKICCRLCGQLMSPTLIRLCSTGPGYCKL